MLPADPSLGSPTLTSPRHIRPAALAVLLAAAFASPALGQGGGTGGPTGTTPESAPPPPTRTPRLVVDRPQKKTLIREGQAGRRLLGGRWYFRFDPSNAGERGRFFRQRSLRGWSAIRLPFIWNGADTTLNRAGFGWYRKELRLPRGRARWKLRFESVIARAVVWVNGRRQEIPTGQLPYIPVEFDLKGLRRGRNRIVVRVSNKRGSNDLTHWRPFAGGGWWNFGGISREVYLRKMRGADIEHVAVQPRVRRLRGPVNVRLRVRVRNLTRRARTVQVAFTLGGKGVRAKRLRVSAGVGGNSRRTIRTRMVVRRPRLWSPRRPRLYKLTAGAAIGGRRVAAYRTTFGIRRVSRTRGGQIMVNGRKLQALGASLHEDHPRIGAASTPGERRATLSRLRLLGAKIARAHYPLHPALMEAFDRRGILYWSQAPVYQLPPLKLANRRIRKSAVRANELTTEVGFNHPSIIAWSIANELPDELNPASQRFINEARRRVKRLDRTRLVAIDRQSRLNQPDPVPAIRRLDAIGINEYFGWYNASLRPHPTRPGRYISSTTADLGPFLDRTAQLYPGRPLVITEFGAESNRAGPASQKGTYAFQTNWTLQHLRLHSSRPFVNGSLLWALKDFRVHPTWGGGNPRPNPPWNNKSLIDETGAFKPGFGPVRDIFRRTPALAR